MTTPSGHWWEGVTCPSRAVWPPPVDCDAPRSSHRESPGHEPGVKPRTTRRAVHAIPFTGLKGIACTALLVVRGLTPGSCPGLSLCDERGASQSTGGGQTARLVHVTPSHQWPLGVVMVLPSQGYPVAGGGARRYAGPHGVRRRHGGS